MKTINVKKLVYTTGLLLGMAAVSGPAIAAAQSAAVATVRGYMDALLAGDTGGMDDHLGARMLAERGPMLANPSYGRTLMRAYKGATYKVVESDQRSDNQASVLVKIVLANSEHVHVRFLLTNSGDGYAIVSES